MINIGIDFGSTYTMVSVYENEGPTTVQPDGLTYSYPSLVVYDNQRGKYFFGNAARSKIGKRNVSVFRCFKMLLNQQMSEENLRSRGYDEINTPEYITSLFLRYVIENTLRKRGEDRVHSLVLGAPECWFQSLNTIDARGTLRGICTQMSDLVDEVNIVSEPTNAAAFCVWNYEQEVNNDFNGNILVVDYGGGTLDTALVSVQHINDSMIIKPEMRSGAGENKNNEIGKAGIAFQEMVVRKAICEVMGISDSEIAYDSQFNGIVKDFEEALLSQAEEIEETISEYNLDPEGLRDVLFEEFEYREEGIPINYYQMYQTYCENIEPVLKEVLDETVKGLVQQENLHIALVGGFCNFYLVKKQIFDYFKIGTIDERVKGMIRNEADREKAIAHGAAIFAEEVMTVCNIAQFSIGTYAEYLDGTIFNHYAINYGQEIEVDKVYFAEDNYHELCPMFASNIDKFLLNFTKNESKSLPMRPKTLFAERLQAINHGPCVVIGFSMDAADRITVHVYNYDLEAERPDSEPVASILLSTLKDMFENTILTNRGDR